MLVDHADAAGDRLARRIEVHGVTVEQNLAFVRRGQPIQHIHERGLAGPVLAHEAEHAAPLHGQADAAEGRLGTEGAAEAIDPDHRVDQV